MKKLALLLPVFAFLLTAAAAPKAAGAKFPIAVKGEAAAVIVHDANSHRTIKLAAQELQNYFRKITTARLPIHNEISGANTPYIILGTPESTCIKPVIKGKAAALLKQLKDDGYAVILRGRRLYLVGNTPPRRFERCPPFHL